MDERIKSIIHKAVDDAGRYPFLFIGSGLSRRYCGTPGWEGLLSDICAEVLDDPYAFARFKSQAKIAHMTQSAVKSHNGPADRLQSVGGACR
ncbi:hypothetical protein GT516_08875, partial [Collinsella sp. BIOML-A4]|uniref:hypothetical protein n=1 Tax=unclassified Collinsella TaxID=2637548 RepID=UPI00137F5910